MHAAAKQSNINMYFIHYMHDTWFEAECAETAVWSFKVTDEMKVGCSPTSWEKRQYKAICVNDLKSKR